MPKLLREPQKNPLQFPTVNSIPTSLFSTLPALTFISPKQHILIKCGQDTSRQNLTQSILATDSILVQLVYFQHKPASGLRPRFLDSVSSSILKPVFLKITDILSYLLLLWILSEKPCNKSYCTDPLYAISFHKLLLCWLIVNAYDFC